MYRRVWIVLQVLRRAFPKAYNGCIGFSKGSIRVLKGSCIEEELHDRGSAGRPGACCCKGGRLVRSNVHGVSWLWGEGFRTLCFMIS